MSQKTTLLSISIGVLFAAMVQGGYLTAQASGLSPIYRFWSDSKQGHFYTISAQEKENIIANDPSWSYEGISQYSFSGPGSITADDIAAGAAIEYSKLNLDGNIDNSDIDTYAAIAQSKIDFNGSLGAASKNLIIGNGGAALTHGSSNEGYYNTIFGIDSSPATTTGFYNTTLGYFSLNANETGNSNTALGYSTLSENTAGWGNTAIGLLALQNNTTGVFNFAGGAYTLSSNSEGDHNIAVGLDSLDTVTTGNYNTALGYESGSGIVTGSENIAIGKEALEMMAIDSNPAGTGNIAIGSGAGAMNGAGNNNIFIGKNAGLESTGSNKIFIGEGSAPLIYGESDNATLYINGVAVFKKYSSNPPTCDATLEGGVIYNDTGNFMCFCNASAWQKMDNSGSCF